MIENLNENALQYHRSPLPGKLTIIATKPLSNQKDLSLAYSPGVAAACEAIVANPQAVSELTIRGNLVGVISNGTAVLGLGNIGPLAAKPVMEGKAVLFKKFANIDVFDIEINESDPDKLVEIIASLEPTFGALNLEDIRAPECFEIEQKLQKRLQIPVFHDDQHGTAIIVAAAILNGLYLVNKKIEEVKLVTSGAGAAAIACLDLLVSLGLPPSNIYITDMAGVVYSGRLGKMDSCKKRYAQDTSARTLEDALEEADIFLGLSVGKVVHPIMLKKMNKKPLIFALANPEPEIRPEDVKEICPDAIVATGRSDYPNQVNNVLCFPFIFRGALDVGATCINQEMKLACVHAIATLARAELSDIVQNAYGDERLTFGPDYLIPKPFDPRLMGYIAPAVAKAAIETGVARKPIEDFEIYKHKLDAHVFRSGLAMRPIFNSATANPKMVVFADGEDIRVLQACQIVCDEKIAKPILVGRRKVVEMRLQKLNLRLAIDHDIHIVDPEKDERYKAYWQHYHHIMERKGVTPDLAKTLMHTNTTVIGAMMLRRGEADALLCGPVGRYAHHLDQVLNIIGLEEGVGVAAGLSVLVLEQGVFFFCDAYVNEDPTAKQLAEIASQAAKVVRQFGIIPKIALLSHSSFGSSLLPSALKMQEALKILRETNPHLEVEGEMHADAALNEQIRESIFPNSYLFGSANLMIMPTLDSAHISYNMVKGLTGGQSIGPILLGVNQSVHILTPSTTVRGIVNMTAVSVTDAQRHHHPKSP